MGPRFPLFDALSLTELRLTQWWLALGADAPKDAVAIEVVIIVLPWRRCVPNSALTRECSLVKYRQSRRSSVRLPHCSVSLSDKFHASPASNNHYVLLGWQLDNKSTRPSVIEHARHSLITCVVIFLWGCNYQKINKFTALQRDAVRIQFGSRSTWLFSISEGDRNLADLARQWRGGGGGGVAGWVELVNLKVIGVWASTLPSLPLSTRSALLSKFLPGGKQWGGAAENSLNKNMAKVCPHSNNWSND